LCDAERIRTVRALALKPAGLKISTTWVLTGIGGASGATPVRVSGLPLRNPSDRAWPLLTAMPLPRLSPSRPGWSRTGTGASTGTGPMPAPLKTAELRPVEATPVRWICGTTRVTSLTRTAIRWMRATSAASNPARAAPLGSLVIAR
jgi:hypothetical protein